MHSYDTVSEAVNKLRERGYTLDFNIRKNALECSNASLRLSPQEFEIAEVYRFEGNTDPADEAVVYAIEGRHGQKGILVNGYGPNADAVSNELVKKLAERH